MEHPPISIEALMVLDAIADRGSYAAAAEKLNRVPSALSYIVQKLEEQLDVTLFQKQGRRSVLTPAGKHLLAEGRHILVAINKISEQTKIIANGWEPKIRIALDSIIDSAIIFPVLKTFLDSYPNIELDISEEVLNGSWEAIIDDKVDLLIGAPPPIPVQKGIRTEVIGELSMIFCVNSSHPLAHLTSAVTKDALSNYRTIIVHDTAKLAIPWTTTGVIEQSERFYVASIEQKIQAILAGIGGGFLPKKRIQHLLDQGKLIEVKVSEPVQQHDLYMAWKIVNKGKGLQHLRKMIIDANFQQYI